MRIDFGCEMKEEARIVACIALLIFAGGFTLGLLVCMGEYKKGQVDALTGNVKYELVKQPDKSIIWEKIND